MAWGNFWVPLLRLLLLMKQSHTDSDQFMDVELVDCDLDPYVKGITDLKDLKENDYGKIEVRIYIEIYTHKPFILELHILIITEL